MMNYAYVGAGLSFLKESVVQHWIGPAFLIILAGLAVKTFMGRQMRAFVGLIICAIIAALLIYTPDFWVGKDGKLTNIARDVVTEVGN